MNMITEKKILITGGSGSIGSYLIQMLDESNEILNIDKNPPDDELKDKMIFKKADLAENVKIEEIVAEFKPEILFHLAASFQRTSETIDFRNECFLSNVLGTHNIFEACIKNSIKQIIFPSSYLIYDQNCYLFSMDDLNHEPIAISEDFPVNPRNITGAAKLYAEKELEFYERMGIVTTSLRIFRVYGPKNQDIIDRWISSLIQGDEINVYGEQQNFDYVHAKDCALACLQAAKMKKNGIFNIGSGIPTSVHTVLRILENLFDTKFKIKKVESKDLQKLEKSYANIKKAKEMLKYEPKIGIEEGIKINFNAIKKEIS